MKKIFKITLCFVMLMACLFSINCKKASAVASTSSPVELRGVWVATVSNIDISKQTGTTEKAINEYKAKLTAILNRMENYGMNCMFFQVRPANDAFYESEYNPYSKYFAGLGTDPGWDMLSWLCDEAHARGIQVHGWLNPYRVTGETCYDFKKDTLEEINEVKKQVRAQVKATGQNINNPVVFEDDTEFLETVVAGAENQLVLNPAREATITHIENTISELIENYDLDGIHFDDYFYPSGGIEGAVEQKDYNLYCSNGGTLNIKDWRRENVNKMVKAVSDIVSEYNKTSERYCAFGISPASVWAPGPQMCSDDNRVTEGGMAVICGSYSSYLDLYADTRKWVREEWLDYILPQNYTGFNDNYKEISKWWANEVAQTSKVKLYIGTGLYRFSNNDAEFASANVVQDQMNYNAETLITKRNVSGYVMFSYRNLTSSQSPQKEANQKLQIAWSTGALLPTYRTSTKQVTGDPAIRVSYLSGKYSVQFSEVANANGYAMYALPNGVASYTDEGAILSKVYNQSTGSNSYIYKTTDYGVQNNRFVLVVFDENNAAAATYNIDFSNPLQNEGPIVTMEADQTSCAKGDTIKLTITAESTFDLDLTVKLYVKQDDGEYNENHKLSINDDGLYTYDYETFKDGTITFKVVVSDGDKEKVIELDPINVGKGNTNPEEPEPIVDPEPEQKEKQPSTGGCSFGSVIILPFMAASILLIIRKRER